MQEIFLATFLIRLKQIASILSGQKKQVRCTDNLSVLFTHLQVLQQQLLLLSSEDVSHDVPFLKELAITWRTLKEHLVPVQRPSETDKKIILLFRTIGSFCQDNDYPLSAYLLDGAEEDRFPFPLMNLLSRLHQEYQRSKSHSTLSSWLFLIEELIDDLFSSTSP